MSSAGTVVETTRPSCSACNGAACDRCFQSGLEPFPTGFNKDELVTATSLFPGMTHQLLFGAAPEIFPPVIVNSDFIPLAGGIRNQTTTSGCVGFTFAEALSLLFAGLGLTKIFSAYFFYWLGRAVGLKLEGLPNTTVLDDAGTSPAQVVQGLVAGAGAALESAMPSTDPTQVNVPEKSAQASDASRRIQLVVSAFVEILADNDTDTETAVLQGLLPRADGKRGRSVMIAVCADPLQVADGSYVIEPSLTGRIDHMIEIEDGVVVTSFDLDTMTGMLANGLTLTWKIPPVVGDRVYRCQNHWGTEGHPRTDIPGTFWCSRAFMLAAQFKYAIQIDTAALEAAA